MERLNPVVQSHSIQGRIKITDLEVTGFDKAQFWARITLVIANRINKNYFNLSIVFQLKYV